MPLHARIGAVIRPSPTEPERLARLSTAVIAAMSVALAAFAWLGTYNRLTADDYPNTSHKPVEAIGDLLKAYRSFTGRYSSTLLSNLLLPCGVAFVRILPSIVLAVWMLALVCLFRELLAGMRSLWRNVLFVSAVILWATIDGALSPGQSLYWATGMIVYTAPLIAQTFLAAMIVRDLRTAEPHSWSRPVWITALAFVAAGFSETTLALQAAAVAVAFCLRPSAGLRPFRLSLWATGAATAVSFFLQVLAPGTAGRQAQIARACAPVLVPARAMLIGPASAARLLFSKPMVIVVLLAAGFLLRWQLPLGERAARAVPKQLSQILFAAWVLTTVASLPASYALCMPPNSRSHIALHFSMVLAVFGCGYVLGSAARIGPYLSESRLFVPLAGALLVAAPIWSAANVVSQFPQVARYAAAWDARDQTLRKAARFQSDEITVDPLPESSAVVHGLAVPGRDPMAEPNQRVAHYYGLPLLRVTEDPQGTALVEPWTREWCARLYHHLRMSGTTGELLAPAGPPHTTAPK
jgi:hypothetical protein